YAYISYQTAYLKCYYETEFITAILNARITNGDDITKYVSFARGSEGIEVLPPNVNKSSSYFKVEGKAIRFGLGGLKHVGTTLTDVIIKEREENGEFKSFEDMVSRIVNVGANKKAIECLILSGACDLFGKSRSQLMAVYEKVIDRAIRDKKSNKLGQISFFGENQIEDNVDYPDIKEFNKKTLLKNEREIIGVYMSGHPLQDYVKKFENYTLTSDMLATSQEDEMEEAEFSEEENVSENSLQDGQPFVCGGIITSVTRKRSKNGREMCYVKLEDLKGVIELTFFTNAYMKYRNVLVEDALVTVKGKINVREGMPMSAVGDIVIPWKEEDAEGKVVSKERLCLRFDTKNPDIYSKVKNSISSYPGETQVVFRCTSSNKTFVYQDKVKINNYLVNELSGIIGNENIVVQ
ncbi:MAG: hypothetical protein K2K31_02650, partial [Clostridia bacterium]|nr:hypothetical protein [Clostridia bacterium]